MSGTFDPDRIPTPESSRRFPAEKYLYRRQYVMAPEPVRPYGNWETREVSRDLILSHHPDLEVTVVDGGRARLVLLGHILDPSHPRRSNRQILASLARNEEFESVLAGSAAFGGRWAIVWVGANGVRAFHDATGARQIYFAGHSGSVLCASQPHLIGHLLGLSPDQDPVVDRYVRSRVYREHERPWAGDSSPVAGVRHLLPNRWLDLNSARAVRYWPCGPLPEPHAAARVESSCEMLRGMLKATAHRFSPMLAVTAGWDSRVLLAASRGMQEEFTYFIHKSGGCTERHRDLKAARALAEHLGLDLKVIAVDEEVPEDFTRLFRLSVAVHQTDSKIPLHYNFASEFEGRVFVSGNASEVARGYYGWPRGVDARRLAGFWGARGAEAEFLVREFDSWFREAREPCERSGVAVTDLFYWEQRMGNWGAMYCADSDIAVEVVWPFNCRRLLEILLSAPRERRAKPHHRLYVEIIENLWPGALRIPLNDLPVYGARKWTHRFRNLDSNDCRRVAARVLPYVPSPLLSCYRRAKHWLWS